MYTVFHLAQTFRSRPYINPSTVTLLLQSGRIMLVKNLGFRDLDVLSVIGGSYHRNSYRYRIWHIYETVKLDQIEYNSITVKVKKDIKLSLSMV
jgi:hypothetical protein